MITAPAADSLCLNLRAPALSKAFFNLEKPAYHLTLYFRKINFSHFSHFFHPLKANKYHIMNYLQISPITSPVNKTPGFQPV